jgi:hypothetical protein
MCQCNPVITLTSEGARLAKILKVLFFLCIFLIVAKLVLGDLHGGLSGLILCAFIVITFLSCHYLFAGYTIFFAIFSLFYTIVFIGLRVQNKMAGLKDKFLMNNIYTFLLVVEVLSFFYYFVLIYYSFQSYREFKAIYLNGGGYCKIK